MSTLTHLAKKEEIICQLQIDTVRYRIRGENFRIRTVDAKKSRVQLTAEPIFGNQKRRMGPFVGTISRVTTKFGQTANTANAISMRNNGSNAFLVSHPTIHRIQ